MIFSIGSCPNTNLVQIYICDSVCTVCIFIGCSPLWGFSGHIQTNVMNRCSVLKPQQAGGRPVGFIQSTARQLNLEKLPINPVKSSMGGLNPGHPFTGPIGPVTIWLHCLLTFNKIEVIQSSQNIYCLHFRSLRNTVHLCLSTACPKSLSSLSMLMMTSKATLLLLLSMCYSLTRS